MDAASVNTVAGSRSNTASAAVDSPRQAMPVEGRPEAAMRANSIVDVFPPLLAPLLPPVAPSASVGGGAEDLAQLDVAQFGGAMLAEVFWRVDKDSDGAISPDSTAASSSSPSAGTSSNF